VTSGRGRRNQANAGARDLAIVRVLDDAPVNMFEHSTAGFPQALDIGALIWSTV
jgi:hypothetical protein